MGRLLGRGGAGHVHLAWHPMPGGALRYVALKLLNGEGDLQREARLGGVLRHRNLVDVYEVGQLDGQAFCAMELCEGGALSAHAPLSARAAVEVGMQVCAALDYAHEALGLVHLDIKPENLLVQGTSVKLADLGIARAAGFGAETGGGTPAYMAPEQRRRGIVDARSDIYSLGKTLETLVSPDGTTDGDTVDWWTDEPEDVVVKPSDVPAALRVVLDRCTADAPSERWQSAADLADALAALSLDGVSLSELLDPDGSGDARLDEPGSLPVVPRLYGRQQAQSTLQRLLDRPGLVSVTGAPGIGKSSLVVAVATRWSGEAVYVDVGDTRSLMDVLVRVAAAMRVQLNPDSPHAWGEQLGRTLASQRHLLLVLDGIDGIGDIVRHLTVWMRVAPALHLCVTSRARPDIDEQQECRVEPLSASFAKRLLRSRAARRGVQVESGRVLDQLIHRLDGVPLAIELAAGRLGVLSLDEVCHRLSPDFLRSSADGHRSALQVALDDSWDLLSSDARALLVGLSVFEKPSSVSRVHAVLDTLEIDVEGAAEQLSRYSLLSLVDGVMSLSVQVRAYAAGRLAESGKRERVRQRHAMVFSDLIPLDLHDRLRGPERRRWVMLLQAVGPDLWKAAEFSSLAGKHERAAAAWRGAAVPMARAGEAERVERLGARIAAGLDAESPEKQLVANVRADLLRTLGRLTEALGVLSASETGASREFLPLILFHRALVYLDKGDLDAAMGALRQCVPAFQEYGPVGRHLRGLGALGTANLLLGRVKEAEENYRHALHLAEESSDEDGTALITSNLANLLRQTGRWAEARRAYATSLRMLRELGNHRQVGHLMGNLAYLYRLDGSHPLALEAFDEAIRVARHHGDRYSEGVQLINLSILLVEMDRETDAEPHLRRAVELARGCGQQIVQAYAEVHLGRLLARTGELVQARALIDEACRVVQGAGDPLILAESLGIAAELSWREGSDGQARVLLDRAFSLVPLEEKETRDILCQVERRIFGESSSTDGGSAAPLHD